MKNMPWPQLHELSVRLHPRQGHVHDGAVRVLRQHLDHRGLPRARRAIQQQPQLVGIARDAVLARAVAEMVQQLHQGVLKP